MRPVPASPLATSGATAATFAVGRSVTRAITVAAAPVIARPVGAAGVARTGPVGARGVGLVVAVGTLTRR